MTVLEIPTPDPRTFDDASRPFAEAVASRYAIKRMIGRGGMGVVYLARDRRLDRLVAIKTLPPHLAKDESLRQRFLRETRTAGAMSHPNIVPIHGADEIDGHVYFVMGYVDGESLAAHVRGMGRLEAREVVRILRDVASALAHAHERGTIHRDIKAENILIERASGRALVTDFGIARLAEAAPLTATGQMLGTVYYVSPEQVAGEPVDARSDLYSLGVVGFVALTGRFPFESELASAVLVAHVNKAAPRVRSINPDVPVALAEIIDRCLAKQPDRRYASAEAVVDALTAVRFGQSVEAAPPVMLSDTEAKAVWGRAALLQASTSERSRPVAPAAARDRERTSGVQLSDVVAAGREAGINTRYLDRALVEHGLAGARPAHAERPRKSWWAGVPLNIAQTADIDGEVRTASFDRLLGLLREGTGLLGTTTASTRELAWRAEWGGHRLEAAIVPSEGRTTISVIQTVRRAAARIYATTLVVAAPLGLVTAAISDRIMHRTPTPHWVRSFGIDLYLGRAQMGLIAASIGVIVVLSAIPIARALIRRMYDANAARLRLLAGALAANARLATREDE